MTTIACLLSKEGYGVLFYCYDSADFYSTILEEAGVPIFWDLENNYIKRIFKVRQFIRKGNFDTVISFRPTCNFLNNVSAIGKRGWHVITGERSAYESLFTSFRGKLFNRFQRNTDFIVCNSQNACRMWEQHCPQYVSKLKVIYNCVQLGEVWSNYEPKKDNRLHILVAATYQYLKNPLGLVEALTLMDEEERNGIVIDWYGRIEMSKGDTQAYDDTIEVIKKNKLENTLFLHPDTKEIADLMYQADVIMLLSKFEGLPNVVCEGMMLGKPIIMTRVSDYDVLVGECNGFLCDSDNPETIKNAILSMANLSIDQLKVMGDASQRKAMALFANDAIVDKWMKLLN